MCEDEGESLDDLINDGFMIKCEGCDQILKTNTFFKHASHSQKCKAVYGERLEVMKKEKIQTILDPGFYYLEVFPVGAGATDYRLIVNIVEF